MKKKRPLYRILANVLLVVTTLLVLYTLVTGKAYWTFSVFLTALGLVFALYQQQFNKNAEHANKVHIPIAPLPVAHPVYSQLYNIFAVLLRDESSFHMEALKKPVTANTMFLSYQELMTLRALFVWGNYGWKNHHDPSKLYLELHTFPAVAIDGEYVPLPFATYDHSFMLTQDIQAVDLAEYVRAFYYYVQYGAKEAVGYFDALKSLNGITREMKKHALFAEATCLAQLGNHGNAVEAYTRYLNEYEQGWIIYYNRGQALLAWGQAAKAVDDITRAIELEMPYEAKAYYFRGLAYAQQGLHAEAIEDLREAMANNLRHKDYLYALGSSLYELGRIDMALESYNMVIHDHPNHAKVLIARASIYQQQQNKAAACADYTTAINLNPDLTNATLAAYCNS